MKGKVKGFYEDGAIEVLDCAGSHESKRSVRKEPTPERNHCNSETINHRHINRADKMSEIKQGTSKNKHLRDRTANKNVIGPQSRRAERKIRSGIIQITQKRIRHNLKTKR